LRTYLAMLAASVALPLLALAVYFLEQAAHSHQARVEQQLLQTSQALVSGIDREIDKAIAILETLAASSALLRGDFASFHAQARRATHGSTAAILLINRSHQQLANTWVDYGVPLPLTSDSETAARVFTTKQPQVSDLFYGAVSKRPAINVFAPVVMDGEVKYALIMTFDAGHFADLLQSQALEPQWITGITDKKGIVLARSQQHRDFVGKPLPAELFKKRQSERAAFRGVSIAGVPIVSATTVSQRSGWLVSATAPASVVDAPRSWARLVYLLLVACTLVSGGAVAILFASFINRSLRGATHGAAQMGRGLLVESVPSHLIEANEIIAALNRASYERKESEATNALLAAVVSSTGDAVLGMDLTGRIRTWNAAAQRIFGFSAEEAVGQSAGIVVPEDRAAERAAIYEEIWAGRTVSMETVRRSKTGKLIDVSINVAPLRAADGKVIGICSVVHDITNLKQREEHAQLLLRELAHRTKNLLAIISGMARETAKHSVDLKEFGARFASRIQGLAGSQDLLLQKDWNGAYLEDLVRSQLRPFIEKDSNRLRVQGPEVFLKPEAVHNLGMVLHELATNASKYGALSVPEGHVEIEWNLDPAPADARLHLTWRERGGPAPTVPIAKGFGHVVIEGMICRLLDATVALDYAADGFVWTARIPTRFLVATAVA
jgi:PAS domain S-box-containing protein